MDAVGWGGEGGQQLMQKTEGDKNSLERGTDLY